MYNRISEIVIWKKLKQEEEFGVEEKYKLIIGYKNDESLRKGLSDLAKKTFGIEFEAWYYTGYWKDNYIPYSIALNGKVIANVSVNLMDFMEKGRKRHFIQLGTVMTDKEYRGKGLSKRLMETILEEYKGKAEGIYLFANDNVLDFYPKFGFIKSKEFQCIQKVNNTKKRSAVLLPMNTKDDWKRIEEVSKNAFCNGAFVMDNLDLLMYYVTSIFNKNIYYIEEKDTYVIAQIDGEKLRIYLILSKDYVREMDIIDAFGHEIKEVIYEYTPLNMDACERKKLQEENTTLFVMGEGLSKFHEKKIMFPVISHA